MRGIPAMSMSGTCSLDMEYMAVTTLENIIDKLKAVPNLTALSLKGNRLATLPTDLSFLTSLKSLDLTSNMYDWAQSTAS